MDCGLRRPQPEEQEVIEVAEFMAEIYAQKIKSGEITREITKSQAIKLFRQRFDAGLMEALEAINIAIGDINSGGL
jgi:hypothetical protein